VVVEGSTRTAEARNEMETRNSVIASRRATRAIYASDWAGTCSMEGLFLSDERGKNDIFLV
jgi:hypothetical protein